MTTTKKILLGIGVTAVLAGGGYMAYKHLKKDDGGAADEVENTDTVEIGDDDVVVVTADEMDQGPKAQ